MSRHSATGVKKAQALKKTFRFAISAGFTLALAYSSVPVIEKFQELKTLIQTQVPITVASELRFSKPAFNESINFSDSMEITAAHVSRVAVKTPEHIDFKKRWAIEEIALNELMGPEPEAETPLVVSVLEKEESPELKIWKQLSERFLMATDASYEEINISDSNQISKVLAERSAELINPGGEFIEYPTSRPAINEENVKDFVEVVAQTNATPGSSLSIQSGIKKEIRDLDDGDVAFAKIKKKALAQQKRPSNSTSSRNQEIQSKNENIDARSSDMLESANIVSVTQRRSIDISKVMAPARAAVQSAPSLQTEGFKPLALMALATNQNGYPEMSSQPAPQAIQQLVRVDSQENKPKQQKESLNLVSTTMQQVVKSGKYTGHIYEAFSAAKKPLVGAIIQILGTPWTVKSDSNGYFEFAGFDVSGVLPVIIQKEEHLPRRTELSTTESVDVELISENAALTMSLASNDRRSNGTGVIFGELVSPENESVSAMKVGLQLQKAQMQNASITSPVYLDDKGLPQAQMQMTSSRGQFMFNNVIPGDYLLTITDAFGQERAPHLIHISVDEGIVRKVSTGTKQIVRGIVRNAIADVSVGGAKLQILGSSRQTMSDVKGNFTIGPLYLDCDDLNYIQIEKQGFYRNRTDYRCSESTYVYTVSSSYVDGAASDAQVSLSATSAVVVGSVQFKLPVKMQLWGPEELNPEAMVRGKDFYVGADGVLNPELFNTKNSRQFVIFDAPEGLSYIQAFSEKGNTLSYWPIFLSPSTVNVYAQ